MLLKVTCIDRCCGIFASADVSLHIWLQYTVHSVSGWMRGVQVKLWGPLRTSAIPERLRGAFMTRRYTNPRLPLPLPLRCAACGIWHTDLRVTAVRYIARNWPVWSSFSYLSCYSLNSLRCRWRSCDLAALSLLGCSNVHHSTLSWWPGRLILSASGSFNK